MTNKERIGQLELEIKEVYMMMDNLNQRLHNLEEMNQKPAPPPAKKAIIAYMEEEGCTWAEAEQDLLAGVNNGG